MGSARVGTRSFIGGRLKILGRSRLCAVACMRPTVAAVLLTAICAVPSLGRTLFVAKSAGAEYSTIHAAIAASLPGDTIRIGPGRYDDFHPLVAPAWTRDVIAVIDKTGLTFIGAGPDSTIVGPKSPVVGADVAPAGFAAINGASATIIGVGVENVDNGVYWDSGGVTIDQCAFREYVLGIVVFQSTDGVRISESEFCSSRSQAVGVLTNPACNGLAIAACRFIGPGINESAIAALGTSGVIISECTIQTEGGIQFDGAVGRIEGCVASSPTGLAVWANGAAVIELYGNSLTGDYAGLYVNGWSVVTGTRNLFAGGFGLATIYITSQSQVTLSGNDIFKTGEYAAMIGQYFYEIQTNDLSGNFWGTSDPDSIAAWIWDYSDDPVTRAHIDYIPFATSTVPTKATGLGDLKALFLGR